MTPAETMPISLKHIEEAAARIAGEAVRTPVIESDALNRHLGARILIKPENLQRTGSFKFRGAFNRLSQLSSVERAAGVVAWSSGNHAQGVAAAAERLNIPAAIVMPKDAPRVKLHKTRAFGAETILYDRETENREDIARRLASTRGAILVPSYDDVDIIAGQGTVGLEFARQASANDARLDLLLVCCGGGGLIAGVATAFAALSPTTDIFSVEPDGFDDHARSLISKRRERNPAEAGSICDALLAPTPGEITFAINRRLLKGGLSVSDDETRAAIRYAADELKLVTEPGGAVALAAALHRRIDCSNKTVGIVVSGGNIDPHMLSRVVGDPTSS